MLSGKTAIVTGASRGIGAAIAAALAAQGASVALLYAGNTARAEEVCARCAGYGVSARSYQCDVSDFAQVTIAAIKRDFGGASILVNNAGINRDGLIAMMKEADFDDVIATNLKGTFNMIRHCCPLLLRSRGGSIINISSMRGLDSPHFPFYPPELREAQPINYTTEKWAMVGMTKYLAGWYGAYNIRVNCIAPGGFNPGISDTADGAAFEKTYVEHCPLHRWAGPDDIKGPVVFLASAAANYVTGAVLVMDGGWTIW